MQSYEISPVITSTSLIVRTFHSNTRNVHPIQTRSKIASQFLALTAVGEIIMPLFIQNPRPYTQLFKHLIGLKFFMIIYKHCQPTKRGLLFLYMKDRF